MLFTEPVIIESWWGTLLFSISHYFKTAKNQKGEEKEGHYSRSGFPFNPSSYYIRSLKVKIHR